MASAPLPYHRRVMTTPARPPSDDEVLAILRSTFGYSSFRPLQREIVRAMLTGQDVFVLMPTGGGKSLCYQLPAVLGDGVTVVVSPLIALMKDQVDALQGLGVPAAFVNSSLSSSEIGQRQAALARGQIKLLYVAPERLMAPGFLGFLSSMRVARFVIDEAHCISEWGHDFRPEYRELRRLRAAFPSAGLSAFTATATGRVQADILAQLGLHGPASFRGSFNRPNLLYQVRPKEGAYQQLAAYLKGQGNASGIIYCQSRADTTALALQLKEDGFNAAAYHAGLASDERKGRQEAFTRDDTPIIVATIAFGLGIDKPDVRFVVHYDLPKSLEGYYQESGRAGRDGEPSDCILFYSYRDVAKQEYFIQQKLSDLEQRVARQQLRRMVQWAESAVCRRRVLLSYFDEPFDGQPDPCCDLCANPRELEDWTIAAQMLLSCAKRTGERFGMVYLIDVLRGSRTERIVRYRHDRLPTHGVGRDRSAQDWQQIGRKLLQASYLRQAEDEFNAIKVTERGHAVLFRNERVFLAIEHAEPRRIDRAARSAPAAEGALFEELRALRKRLADERGVPPYIVFHDTTLRQMAASRPTSRAQLLRIEGVGQRKIEDYDAFLACIAAHTGGPGQPDPTPRAAPRPAPTRLGPSAARTLELFREGFSPVDIAARRQLVMSTVKAHLAEALEAGEAVEVDRLVSAEKQVAIRAAIARIGPGPLRPVKELLGDDYTYGEIRLVRAGLPPA